jgi:tetratricopeptide (TPR) repeat protein
MIQRDYVLRAIEEAVQVLARLAFLRKEQPEAAEALLETKFQELLGLGAEQIAILPESDLLARIVTGGPTQLARIKCFFLVALLKDTGMLYEAQQRFDQSRVCYLKALNLLLDVRLRGGDDIELLSFVPKVEDLQIALADTELPLFTRAALMQHYERAGDFARAEDQLHAMIESEPDNDRLVLWGIAFYERLIALGDSALEMGNLPRAKIEQGISELNARRTGHGG